MTNGHSTNQKRHYTLTWLPWLLGALVLVLYVTTANRSLSLMPDWTSLLQVPPGPVRMAGYTFHPEFLSPVYYVVTWPLRLLPEQSIPIALNFFSALCGALALAQLARSVALLPHDRTRDQREREGSRHALLSISLAWLPPLFATVVCALSLSFWEHGTNGTSEMFDLLLFSYVVRSLLEYRIDQKESRLYRTAFVFGAAMTNNLAMIAFFPLFIVALVWTRKLAFFNLKFLARMALCGLGGLLFYLVLPIVGSLQDGHSMSFWQLLSYNLTSQKWLLMIFPRNTILLLSLTSILPLFLFSIKWSSQFGDPSRLGVIITTITFHLCHIVVLLACLWMALDPDFSPRQVGLQLWAGLGFGPAFLPLYFLAALNIGYYSGYLLLVSRPSLDRFRNPPAGAKAMQFITTGAMLLLLIAVPTALLHRNLPQIRLTNGPLLPEFTERLVENLPPNGVIISDDQHRLWLVQNRLAKLGRTKDYVPVYSEWLEVANYHQYLKKRYPKWTTPEIAKGQTRILQSELLALMEKIGQTQPITYLHPSFGYYFESFDSQPMGLVLRLTPQNTNNLVAPPASPEAIARNQELWASISNQLSQTLIPHIQQPDITASKLAFPENLYQTIGLKPPRNRVAHTLGGYYSRSLVNYAVELQRADQYAAAVGHYQLAQRLNPKNIVADINLAFNEKIRSGEPLSLDMDRSLEELFGESRSWEQVLARNGPYDGPALSYAQGYEFVQGNLIRQAAQAFERTRAQAPNDIFSRLWLGQINLNRNFPDRTLEMVSEIRQIATRVPGLSTNLKSLFTLEAGAYLAKNEDAIANTIIETNLASYPDNFNLLGAACKAYADNRRYSNALEITERMLKLEPGNASCLFNKGCFLVEIPDYPRAIEAFTETLKLQTNNYHAMLYRGMAQLRDGQLDAALKDYEAVQRQYPNESLVDFGLGEIAYRRRDTNTAVRHYQTYLNNVASTNTAEAKGVIEKLNELKGGKPQPPASPAPPK